LRQAFDPNFGSRPLLLRLRGLLELADLVLRLRRMTVREIVRHLRVARESAGRDNGHHSLLTILS